MTEIEYLLGEKELLEGNIRASRLRCKQLLEKLQCVNNILEEHTKLNKEEFLNTEFGREQEYTITTWDQALEKSGQTGEGKENLKTLAWCQTRWEVYRMAIKHFYGVEYYFTGTDEYYGLCTEDESDWLMKVNRGLAGCSRPAPDTKIDTEKNVEKLREQIECYGVPKNVYIDRFCK